MLKAGGKALILVYHKWGMVGVMLWICFALLAGRVWRGLRSIYAEHLESPGTKAYSYSEARDIFSRFSSEAISTPLSHGNLLDSAVGQCHRGLVLRTANCEVDLASLVHLSDPSAGRSVHAYRGCEVATAS